MTTYSNEQLSIMMDNTIDKVNHNTNDIEELKKDNNNIKLDVKDVKDKMDNALDLLKSIKEKQDKQDEELINELKDWKKKGVNTILKVILFILGTTGSIGAGLYNILK